ncbi:MAG: purine-nucleoside phosphorylase [Planctomycetes bacterium]|nr:purine-nucleoside phosphorylase [Planctomycetota bacterium]
MTESLDVLARMKEAAEAIKARTPIVPSVGVILGTELKRFVESMERSVAIDVRDIPHLAGSSKDPKSAVVLGLLAKIPAVVVEGRLHLYEGHAPDRIVFPVRLIRELGARMVILMNICGAMNPNYRRGDLVLIDDHINLTGVNPLVGLNDERLGPRFPDMSRPYDPRLLDLAEESARRLGLRAHRAVYAGRVGPSLETRAEYRFLRTIGADVVGVSAVLEAIAAVHAGLRVLSVGIVTDLCFPDALAPVNMSEILAAAEEGEPRLTALIYDVVRAESGRR